MQTRKIILIALFVLLPVTSYALEGSTFFNWFGNYYKPAPVVQPTPVKPVPLPPPAPTPPITIPTVPTIPVVGEVRFNAYLTSYTYWDNTPPGSADISHPIIHKKAGGTGTYADPITMAVGHSIINGKDILDYPAGTKFYIPNVRKYFIVEDTCGDGNTPQNGPCHTGYKGNPWLDMWIDGASGSRSSSNTCAENLTDIHLVIKNPSAFYPVVVGPVFSTLCATEWGDKV